MPGSGLKAFKMVDKEVDLADPFFDSEEDDAPVDMEMVFEAMKHVPLPDIDYPDQDDPISGVPSFAETLPGRAIRAQRDPVVPQGVLKRKAGTGGMGQPKKRGAGTGRVSKRLKVEVQSSLIRTKTSPKHAAKAELAVVSVTAAAKVAAQVAPDVVTGGIVAEAGPRPDFSLWTVEDDLLLKNSMEAGAAMEALAKGAMRFSRRFTVRELRERWRALLYDPEIAAQAAARMVEAEYGNTYSSPKSPMEQKSPHELARKRRANSIRTLYYKRSKKMARDNVAPDSTNGLVGNDVEGVCVPSNGVAIDILVESDLRPLPDAMTLGSRDMVSVPPKAATPLDFEDRAFSQMFSLLASGGIRAVIGAIPADVTGDVSEQDTGGAGVDGHKIGNVVPPPDTLPELMGSTEHDGVLQAQIGELTPSDSLSNVPIGPGHAQAQAQTAQGNLLDTSQATLGHDCQSVEESSPFTDPRLEPPKVGLKLSGMGAESSIDCPQEGNFKLSDGTGGQGMIPVPLKQEIVNGDYEDPSGICPVSFRDSDVSGKSLPSQKKLISTADELETVVAEKRQLSVTFSEVNNEHPCATSLVPTVDHGEVFNGDTKVFCCCSPVVRVNSSSLEPEKSTKLEDPSLTVNAIVNNGMEDADTVDPVYIECLCRKYCTADASEQRGDICDGAAMDDQCCLDELHERCVHFAVAGESCSHDLDCLYGEDGCNLRCSKLGPCILEPFVCTLNTEDTEVPSLEDALLSFPSSPLSPSEQGEYVGYTDSPYADADADGYTDNYGDEDVDANVDADVECTTDSPRQGVSSTRIVPEGIDGVDDATPDPAEWGPSVDKGGGKATINPGSSDGRVRGSELAMEEENIGSKCAGQLINPGITTVSISNSDQGVPCASPPAGNLHQQLVPQVVGEGNLQASNNFMVTNWKTSSVVPVIGDIQINMSPMRDLPNGMPPNEPIVTIGEVPNLLQEQPEEEIESDEEMARFSDIEAMILDMDLDVADDDFSARAESRRMYRRHGRAVVRAEQAATAAMQRTLNVRGALAILYGRHLKYYITQTEVLMGRATSDNVVNIDLGKEGRANKVSRQQANIKLKDDGVFYLRNLGRRGLTVNNKPVETGQRAILGSNCLIEVGGMRFIFEINRKLVQEHISRRHQLQ